MFYADLGKALAYLLIESPELLQSTYAARVLQLLMGQKGQRSSTAQSLIERLGRTRLRHALENCLKQPKDLDNGESDCVAVLL